MSIDRYEKETYVKLIEECNLPKLLSKDELIGKTIKEIRTPYGDNRQYLLTEDGFGAIVGIETNDEDFSYTVIKSIEDCDFRDLYFYILTVRDFNEKANERIEEILRGE